MLYFGIAIFMLVLDQITKWWIRHEFFLGESRSIIGDFFRLTSHRNSGAAFGILQGQRVFFIVITIVIVIGLLIYLNHIRKKPGRLLPIALAFVLGGTLGNFIDRVRWGEVVDFFHFYFNFGFFGLQVDYHFPIFNIADSAIFIGVALILLDTLLEWRKERQQEKGVGDALDP